MQVGEQEAGRWSQVLPSDVRSLLLPFLPRGLLFLLRSLHEFARLGPVAASRASWALEYAAQEGRVDVMREMWAEHGRMGEVRGLMTIGARAGQQKVKTRILYRNISFYHFLFRYFIQQAAGDGN